MMTTNEKNPQLRRRFTTATDDLVIDSMLRQLIRSEADGCEFAEKVRLRIQNQVDPQVPCGSQAIEPQDSSDIEQSKTELPASSQSSIFVFRIQLAMLAATIVVIVGLTQLLLSLKAPKQFELADVTDNRVTTHQTIEFRSNEIELAELPEVDFDLIYVDSLLSKLDSDQIVFTPLKAFQPDSFLTQSEPVEAPAALKVVSGKTDPNSAEQTEIRKSREPDKIKNVPDPSQYESGDAPFAPTRQLAFLIRVNRSGYGSLTINNQQVSKRIGPRELADAFSRFEPEISRRISFIGPRIGNVIGFIRFETANVAYDSDFETVGQYQGAVRRVCKRLDGMKTNYKKRRTELNPSQTCAGVAVRKSNEIFRGWAKDSLESGTTSFRPQKDSKSRFRRIISTATFSRFAESGYFEMPDPENIYLPSTTLQHLDAKALKKSLAATRKLDLFRSEEELKQFSESLVAGVAENAQKNIVGKSVEPLKDMLAGREDLQGLPLVMGKACRLEELRADSLDRVSKTIGPILSRFDFFASRNIKLHPGQRDRMLASEINSVKSYFSRLSDSPQSLLTIDQMLQIEQPALRLELVKLLEESKSPVSANLLACYAKYDLSSRVRIMATHSLSMFHPEMYRNELLKGFNYPWTEAAKHSAEALVRLNDTNSIPQLVELLNQPEPSMPKQDSHGQYVKRELVAISHLKNCMLCHADSQALADRGQAPVPEWNKALPRLYYQARSPGLVARADITYMRQDFSVVQKVENAGPWPDHQRFDYVVQSRKLSRAECEELARDEDSDASSVYRESIVFALKMLTSEEPVDNSYSTWKEIVSRTKTTP